MGLIEDFIKHYIREYDFYHEVARLCAQQCESLLDQGGIPAIVTSRAKKPDSLERKLRERAKRKAYNDIDQIHDDIVDLAGVRIALYFPGDRDKIDSIIRSNFDVARTKQFPDKSKQAPEKRFSGYWAMHYRLHLKASFLTPAQSRYLDARIEIQVASVLMHGWAEVEHDLGYKALTGQLSEVEKAILDQLNGLVLAGEIALEQLQNALELRIKGSRAKFKNRFALALYLYESISSRSKAVPDESTMGRVNILYYMLEKANLNTPEKLAPLIKALDADIERRPIADQLIDQILSSNPDLYKDYSEIRNQEISRTLYFGDRQNTRSEEESQAFGFFMLQWITLERLIRRISNMRRPNQAGFRAINLRSLQELRVFDERTLYEIDRIRQFRNYLVHGVEIPDADTLFRAGAELKAIIDTLRLHEDETIRKIVDETAPPPS
jgi:ppGpp synthetase/RelA/SpoT-type nucleotidyltranferase